MLPSTTASAPVVKSSIARGDPADHDGGANNVGRALFAYRIPLPDP
jgi:hypothetical protein